MVNDVFVSQSQLNKLNVTWNNVYRKIFVVLSNGSVKELQYLCGRYFCISIKKLKIHVIHNCLEIAFKNVKVMRLYYSYPLMSIVCENFMLSVLGQLLHLSSCGDAIDAFRQRKVIYADIESD